jgi:hypothetical protein
MRPTPHALLQASVTSPVEDLTYFLRSKLLERLIAAPVYVCSLVGVVFQDNISLIGGQRTGQKMLQGDLRYRLSIGASHLKGLAVIPQKDV